MIWFIWYETTSSHPWSANLDAKLRKETRSSLRKLLVELSPSWSYSNLSLRSAGLSVDRIKLKLSSLRTLKAYHISSIYHRFMASQWDVKRATLNLSVLALSFHWSKSVPNSVLTNLMLQGIQLPPLIFQHLLHPLSQLDIPLRCLKARESRRMDVHKHFTSFHRYGYIGIHHDSWHTNAIRETCESLERETKIELGPTRALVPTPPKKAKTYHKTVKQHRQTVTNLSRGTPAYPLLCLFPKRDACGKTPHKWNHCWIILVSSLLIAISRC